MPVENRVQTNHEHLEAPVFPCELVNFVIINLTDKKTTLLCLLSFMMKMVLTSQQMQENLKLKHFPMHQN